jgi:hypothetical protein
VEGQIAVIMPSLWAVFHEEEIGWSGVLWFCLFEGKWKAVAGRNLIPAYPTLSLHYHQDP